MQLAMVPMYTVTRGVCKLVLHTQSVCTVVERQAAIHTGIFFVKLQLSGSYSRRGNTRGPKVCQVLRIHAAVPDLSKLMTPNEKVRMRGRCMWNTLTHRHAWCKLCTVCSKSSGGHEDAHCNAGRSLPAVLMQLEQP